MRRTFVAIVVLLSFAVSSPSWARDWTYVTTIRDGSVFYIETSTLEERNGYLYIWHLLDYANEEEHGINSQLLRAQIDCDRKRWQVVESHYFIKNMAKGNPKWGGSVDNPKWQNRYTDHERSVIDILCTAHDRYGD